MVKVLLLGLMEENTKEITMMIRNKEEEYLRGQMVDNMMVNGLMENNMVRVYTILQREKLKKENGKMEKESDGSL